MRAVDLEYVDEKQTERVSGLSRKVERMFKVLIVFLQKKLPLNPWPNEVRRILISLLKKEVK